MPQKAVDYAAYERIPNTSASLTFRALAKTNPMTRGAAFYGRYGGPGNSGGAPVDEMDDLFRRHDIIYYSSKTKEIMQAADTELVVRLRSLKPDQLDEHGRRFKERAIGFFESTWSKVIGKPWSTLFWRSEPSDCMFCSPTEVRAFFRPDHDGIPGKAMDTSSGTAR